MGNRLNIHTNRFFFLDLLVFLATSHLQNKFVKQWLTISHLFNTFEAFVFAMLWRKFRKGRSTIGCVFKKKSESILVLIWKEREKWCCYQITYFPCIFVDSIKLRKSSRFCRILLRFSRRSSSARSFTYFSNTCLRSRDVSSKYRGSNTILCNSFSHVLKADTWKQFRND